MVSIPGKLVAQDVIKTVVNGEIPNKKEIQIKRGYSVKSALANKALETRGYKETIESFVDKMFRERTRLIDSMRGKDLSKVDYAKQLMAIDIFTKNINLLTGEATDRVEVNQIIDKFNTLLIEVRNNANSTRNTDSQVLPQSVQA